MSKSIKRACALGHVRLSRPYGLRAAWQTPPSMGSPRQEYGAGCRFLLQGISRPRDLASPALAGKILYPHHLGSPYKVPAWSFSVLLLTVRQRENAPAGHVQTFPGSSATLLRPTQLSRWPCFSWFRKNKTTRNRFLPFLFSPKLPGGVAQPPVTFPPSPPLPQLSSPGLTSLPSPAPLGHQSLPGSQIH